MAAQNPDPTNQQLALLAAHRHTLAQQLEQRAKFSAGFVPAHIDVTIDDARSEISRIKIILRSAGVEVQDEPADMVAPEQGARAASTPTQSNQLITGQAQLGVAVAGNVYGTVIVQAPGLAPLTVETTTKLTLTGSPSQSNPYLGLLTFQETDADRFFGRDELIAELVERAGRASFLAVLGASGSGKSSVVRAGLIPRLKQGALSGSEHWRYATLRPGARPLDTLAAELARLHGDPILAARYRAALDEGNRALLLLAEALLERATGQRLVLVVDQAEELWTNAPADERSRFVELLLTATGAPDTPLLVVLAMRADFLHRALEHAVLGKTITDHDVSVSPMSKAELHEAIVRPAELAGGSFEPGLVDELIEQTLDRSGALPLLEYTLQELWKRHKGGQLTWDAYRALGALEGALAARADALLAEHYTPEQQAEVRRLLLRLVQPGEGTEDTRRRVRLTDAVPSGSSLATIQTLIKPLVDERLLTTGRDRATEEDTVEVSHEALIRAWPTLRAWIDAARADLRLHIQLSESAREWQTSKRRREYLWSGLRLSVLEAWVARAHPDLTEVEAQFVRASRRSAWRARILASSVVGLIALLLIAVGLIQTQRASDADRARQTAEALSDQSATAQALAENQSRIAQSQARASEALVALAQGDRDQATILARAAVLTGTQIYEPAVFRGMHRTLEDITASQRFIGHRSRVYGASWSGDESRVLSWSQDGSVRVWDVASDTAVQVLEGHMSNVNGASWSGDESRVLSWSYDGTVQVWDVVSGTAVQVLKGHTSPVRGASWSKDETRVLSWSDDDTVRVWDVASGKAVQVLEGHTSPVRGASWSGDESRVLSWSEDGTVRVWDVASGTAVQVLGHTDWVSGASWSGDESRVLSWNSDGTVRVWDVASGTAVQVLEGHMSYVSGASWSKDESRVLSWSRDGTVRVWDVASGKAVQVLEGHTSDVYGASWSKDETRVLSWSLDNTVRVWDVASGTAVQVLEGHMSYVSGASWSKDESRVLSWSNDGTVRVWDVASGKAVQVLEGHTFPVIGASWNKDESRVLSWSDDGTVQVWDVASGTAVQVLEGHTFPVIGASWSGDERRVLSWSPDGTVRVWDVASGTAVQVLEGHTNTVSGASWSKDESRVLSWSLDNTVRVWDVASGTAVQVLEGHTSNVSGASWSKDETRVLSWSGDGSVRVWDVASGTAVQVLKGHTSPVIGASWSKDESRVLSWSEDGTVRVWDVASGKAVQVLEGHTSPVIGASWSGDESRVLSWSLDNTVRVWDVASGKAVQVLEGSTSNVSGASWSGDESRVLSWSNDGTVRVWDVASGTAVQVLEGHTSDVYGASWSKDETRVLSWSLDNTVRVWDVASGTAVQVLEGHTNTVSGASWSKDESRVLSWSLDNTVRVWDVASGKAVQVLEGHTSPVIGASWSGDESRVLSWSEDGTVRVWVVEARLLVAELTNRVCHLNRSDAEIAKNIPGWRGCAAELAAVDADLKEYQTRYGPHQSRSQ